MVGDSSFIGASGENLKGIAFGLNPNGPRAVDWLHESRICIARRRASCLRM